MLSQTPEWRVRGDLLGMLFSRHDKWHSAPDLDHESQHKAALRDRRAARFQ